MVRAVLELAEAVSAEVGPLPLMLERDDNFPPWAEHFAELDALADVARVQRITPTSGMRGEGGESWHWIRAGVVPGLPKMSL